MAKNYQDFAVLSTTISEEEEDDDVKQQQEEEEDYFTETDDFDGSVNIIEYDPNVSPLDELITKKKRVSFPRPIKIDQIKHILDLDKLFNCNVEVFKPSPKLKLRSKEQDTLLQNFLESKEKSNNKLCKLLLTQHYCPYNNVCKFSHHFSSVQLCKYDYCRKTKLVGPGTFINTSNFICKMKHRMESIHSFIWRTRHQTDAVLKLYVYSEFSKEFKKTLSSMSLNTPTPNIKIVIIDNNKTDNG